MSHREKMLKLVLRLSYLALVVGFYVGFFFVLESDFWAATFLLICMFWLVMFILSYRQPKMSSQIQEMIKESIFKNPMSLDEVKKAYRFHKLDDEGFNVLRVFFHKNGERRCVVYQESNSVRISFEKLSYNSDMSKMWSLDFAQWESENEESGIYADAELAIKDNKRFLSDFEEDKTEIVKRRRYNIEVLWKRVDLKSDLIPFGSYNKFDIKIKDKVINNVIIHNHHWFSAFESTAYLFVDMKEAFENNKKLKFQILKDGKIIGIGYCFKYNSFSFWHY